MSVLTDAAIPVNTDISFEELCCVIGDGGIIRGYRKDILTENLSEREIAFLICPRCQGILREACLLTNGEQLCLCCINKDEQPIQNVNVRNTVLTLKCSCPLSQRGCEWLGTIGDCEDHLASCSHVNEPCRLGCGAVLQRCEGIFHMKEMCVHRELECETCGVRFMASDKCKHLILCEYGCGVLVCQEKIELHKETECMVKCPFEKYKCGVGMINQQKLKQHLEENRILHTELKLSAMEDLVEQQGNMINTMTQQMELLRADLKDRNGDKKLKLGTSEDLQIEPIRELTHEVGKLTKDLVCLTRYLENKNEHIRDVKDILQIHHSTEKFKCKIAATEKIFDRGLYSFGSSDIFHFKGYNFKFSYETVKNNLVIYFAPQSGQYYDKLSWPFTAEFIIRFIYHSNPSETMEFKSELIEINKEEYNGFTRAMELAKIPTSTQFDPEFLRKGSIDMEIFIIIKNE